MQGPQNNTEFAEVSRPMKLFLKRKKTIFTYRHSYALFERWLRYLNHETAIFKRTKNARVAADFHGYNRVRNRFAPFVANCALCFCPSITTRREEHKQNNEYGTGAHWESLT